MGHAERSTRKEHVATAAKATCGRLQKEHGLKRTTAQRVIQGNLELTTVRKIAVQQVKPAKKEKRPGSTECRKWGMQCPAGARCQDQTFWTNEKLPHLGAVV